MSINDAVVVTGMGAVSPLGLGVDKLWQSSLAGQSVVTEIPSQWKQYADYQSGIWSPLPQIDFREQGFSRTEVLQRDPVSLLALLATAEALSQANLETKLVDKRHAKYGIQGINAERVGVFMGTGIGGAKTFLENNAFQILQQPSKLARSLAETASDKNLIENFTELPRPHCANRMSVPMLMPNSVSASIGIKYGLFGRNRSITHACAAGTTAIGEAANAIANDEIDMAICGGAEYLYDDFGTIYRGFDMLGALAKPSQNIELANRPFDQQRNGFLFSQGGAGVIILESEKHALLRGAITLAKVGAYAESFDAESMVALAEDGKQIERAIITALHKAQLTTSDIGYINAHGTGTETNDRVETDVLYRLFGSNPWVSSSKAILGHAIGASGALEAIITLLTLQQQRTPALINLDHPISPLKFVKNSDDIINAKAALSCSYAFGGHNAALILQTA